MDGFRFASDPDEAQSYSQPKYTIIVNDAPKFELTSYISNYKGRTILTRLYMIASCCPPLREEALKLLIAEAKKGSDTTMYQDAISLQNKTKPPADGSTGLDMAWLEKREKQNAAETARLESELKGYKNNLIKESIRVSASFKSRGRAITDIVRRWATRISAHTTTKSATCNLL
jgi:COP9 signalosome complex subunit 1